MRGNSLSTAWQTKSPSFTWEAENHHGGVGSGLIAPLSGQTDGQLPRTSHRNQGKGGLEEGGRRDQ